jgi:hypothetical protein
LTIDGKEVETRQLEIDPGATQTVNFKVMREESGLYTLAVEKSTATLSVVGGIGYLLYYDDGMPDGFYTLYNPRGHLIHFSPKASPFEIQKVMICGNVSGKDLKDWRRKSFTVNIWNKDLSQKLWSSDPSWQPFTPAPEHHWVAVEVQGVQVRDDFYIEVITNSDKKLNLAIAYDTSVVNEHSDISLYGTVDPWMLELPRGDVNWMIRVEGVGGGISK